MGLVMSRSWNNAHPEKMREATRRYRSAHPERVKAMAKKHRANRREKALVELRAYAEANREKEKVRRKRYRETHRQQCLEYQNHRYATNDNYRVRTIMASRINEVVKGLSKSARTMELVGCSPEELRAHLEAQFTEGMTWDNYGYRGWHIDHIKPCASFDLTDPEQQRQCFHYTNLQPLWAEENMRKGRK
jgi:hypothetical protein